MLLQPFLSVPVLLLTFITFLLLAILSSYLSPRQKKKITLLTKYIFGFHPFLSKRHFMTTFLHLSPPLLIPILSDLSSFTPVFHSFPHFLVLTSLSIRALRVLCTSSPSLSISAFKRSFCSVSSCTFLSFSCSLSLRLFLADE